MARDFHNQARVRTSLFQVCLFFLAVCGCASTAGAQQTRADVLADDRAAKAEGADTSVALERGRLERTFSWAEAKLEDESSTHEGFYPELGGMITGAGISVGPGYRHYLFGESSAPSLAQQPGYLHSDVFLDVDARDVPGYPTSGGRYRVSVAAFHDRTYSQYSYRRVEADDAQYIPLHHKNWVLAVRGQMG